jgi:hypothetical protein
MAREHATQFNFRDGLVSRADTVFSGFLFIAGAIPVHVWIKWKKDARAGGQPALRFREREV